MTGTTAAVPPPDGLPGNRPVSSPRVLLVDDHAPLRRQLRILLQAAGMLVVAEAGDGAEALMVAGMVDPDVVVTDVRMPVVDGLEVTRRLRRDRPELPVVVHTGDDSPVVAELAVHAGAVAVVHKGDLPDVLVGAVRRAAAGVWGRTEG